MENSLPIINFHIQIYQSLDSPRRIIRSTKIYCASVVGRAWPSARARATLARGEEGRARKTISPCLLLIMVSTRSYRARIVVGVLLFVTEATKKSPRRNCPSLFRPLLTTAGESSAWNQTFYRLLREKNSQIPSSSLSSMLQPIATKFKRHFDRSSICSTKMRRHCASSRCQLQF